MTAGSHMKIHDFSILTGISKDTLRFYDKIGLLSPALRGDNDYRYYSDRQIDLAYLIGDLRAIGVGLDDIKQYAIKRSPQQMLSFFQKQNDSIDKEVERLRSIQDLMNLRSDMVSKALSMKENTVVLEQKEREPIFLGPVLEDGLSEADFITLSYNEAASHGVNLASPLGTMISSEVFKTGKFLPCRHYFKVRRYYNAWKDAGTYAVLYRSFEENPNDDYYLPLFSFLKEHKLEIISDGYEECLLDELSTTEREDFTVRIEVMVKSR